MVGISSLVATPQVALANMPNPMSSALAGSLYYTRAEPGRWAGKEGGHVPSFERNGNSLEVTTGHPMDGYVHYIIKHVILNNHLEFVSEQVFNPESDSPISEHDISGLKDTVYVVSVCNKHDAWLNAHVL
jgi:superoxide reductase